MVKSYTHVDDTERRLIQNMHQAGISWPKMLEVTGRSESTLGKMLKDTSCTKKTGVGAPKKLTEKEMPREGDGEPPKKCERT